MNENVYRILIIDDHPIVTDGIEQLLRTYIKAQYLQVNDLNTLIKRLQEGPFNLCICDIESPGIQGFGLLQMVHDSLPQCPMLIYTMHEEPWIVSKLNEPKLRNCIVGGISKHAELLELPRAVEAIREGKEYFSQAFQLLRKNHYCVENQMYGSLSKREMDVLTHLMQGLSTKEIAENMCLSINTIQTYRKRLLEKMNAKNVAELVYKCKGLF